MTLVVTAFGNGLMVAAPGRPGQHVLDGRKRSPDHAPQEAPDFGDGDSEGDQLGDGDGDGARPAA
jgi:hypothetical protein